MGNPWVGDGAPALGTGIPLARRERHGSGKWPPLDTGAGGGKCVVPMAGIGPATSPLPRECSTTEPHGRSIGKDGAGNEIRTRDLNLGKVALYQLSYSRKMTGLPVKEKAHQWGWASSRFLVAWDGIEPSTRGFSTNLTSRSPSQATPRILTLFCPFFQPAAMFTEPTTERVRPREGMPIGFSQVKQRHSHPTPEPNYRTAWP